MSEAQMVRVEVEVPKELCDVKDLLVSIARDLKAGKKPTEVMFGSLPMFQRAFEGIGDIPTELKSAEVYMLGAVLIAELVQIFVPAKADVVAALGAGATAGAAAGAAAATAVSPSAQA